MRPNPESRETLLVVPTYNNASTLTQVLRGLRPYRESLLVVNDGSTDGTSEVLKAEAPRFLIEHPSNQGKGAAILSAFNFAYHEGFRHIITFDADGQHFAADIPPMLAAIKEQPGQLLIGNRRMDAGAGEVPAASRFGRVFSNFWVWVETGKWLQDTQCGLRAYPVNQVLINSLRCRAYDFEVEVLVKALRLGIGVREMPVQVFYPPRAQRVSHFRPWRDNLRLSFLHTKLVCQRLFCNFHRPDSRATASEKKGAGLITFFLKLGGRPLCFLLMPFPLLFYFLCDGLSRDGINRLYGVLGKPVHGSLNWRVFKNYWLFGSSLIDRLTWKQVSINRLDVGHEEFGDRGRILIGAHYGDWFISSINFSLKRDLKVGVVMDETVSPKFHQRVKRLKRGRIEIINTAKSEIQNVLSMKEILDDGGCVCFLGDRLRQDMEYVQIPFLGKPARFPLAPFQVARVLKVPVYFFYCYKSGLGPSAPYIANTEVIWDGKENTYPEVIAKRFTSHLEALVKEHPEHWFNFFNFWETGEQSLIHDYK